MGVVSAVQVDLQDLVELGGRLFEEVGFQPEDAGGADQDVEAAEMLDRPFDAGANRGFVGDVGGQENRLPALPADRVHRFGSLLLEDVGNDQVTSIRGESQGDGAADASGTPGHEGDAALFGSGESELWHGSSVLRVGNTEIVWDAEAADAGTAWKARGNRPQQTAAPNPVCRGLTGAII